MDLDPDETNVTSITISYDNYEDLVPIRMRTLLPFCLGPHNERKVVP